MNSTGPFEQQRSWRISPLVVVIGLLVAGVAGYFVGNSGSNTETKTVTKEIVAPKPSGQRTTEAQTQANVVTAAEAMETCATDNNGSYAGCNRARLAALDPALASLSSSLTTSAGVTDYKVTIESTTGTSFTLERMANGVTVRSCEPPGQAGCDSNGSW